jgi:hypothetical protein
MYQSIGKRLSAELVTALTTFQVNEELEARYDLLADKHTEGTLTSEEKEELDQFVALFHFLSVLKAQAILAEESAAA